MNSPNEAFQAWKDAEALARTVELRLQHCWEAYERAEGPSPPQSLMTDLAKARINANEKLTALMLLVSASAD